MWNGVAALLAAAVLAGVHVLGGRFHPGEAVPRSWLLSAGSGISVAYVFVHLLPELAQIQEHLREAVVGGWLGYLESHAWLMALAGLLVFYGLELEARRRRGADRHIGWLHLYSYAMYNAIVGYLLHQRARSSLSVLALFAIAMGVHFLVNDHGLREHHGELYRGAGRWLVAAGVLVGWGMGLATEITEAALGLLIAFLAGGIIMNVLKEELPDTRGSRWVPMVAGAVSYAALLEIM